MTKHVTHTDFSTLSDNDSMLWIAKSEQFIAKQGWTVSEFDREELLYVTALYLHHAERLIHSKRQFPCYVVHVMEDDSRYETASFTIAMDHFKRLDKDKKRCGVFHWESAASHKRLYASQDYPFTRDYGPQEEK